VPTLTTGARCVWRTAAAARTRARRNADPGRPVCAKERATTTAGPPAPRLECRHLGPSLLAAYGEQGAARRSRAAARAFPAVDLAVDTTSTMDSPVHAPRLGEHVGETRRSRALMVQAAPGSRSASAPDETAARCTTASYGRSTHCRTEKSSVISSGSQRTARARRGEPVVPLRLGRADCPIHLAAVVQETADEPAPDEAVGPGDQHFHFTRSRSRPPSSSRASRSSPGAPTQVAPRCPASASKISTSAGRTKRGLPSRIVASRDPRARTPLRTARGPSASRPSRSRSPAARPAAASATSRPRSRAKPSRAALRGCEAQLGRLAAFDARDGVAHLATDEFEPAAGDS